MFQSAGKALSHTAHAKLPSRTLLSWPQAGAAAEDDLVVEIARVRQADTVKRHGQCWPGIRVRTVTGGLVAYLTDRPADSIPREKHLTGGQSTCSLRRGARRSWPSRPTTKVNGSLSSSAGRLA